MSALMLEEASAQTMGVCWLLTSSTSLKPLLVGVFLDDVAHLGGHILQDFAFVLLQLGVKVVDLVLEVAGAAVESACIWERASGVMPAAPDPSFWWMASSSAPRFSSCALSGSNLARSAAAARWPSWVDNTAS